ncbi:hypothetical protein ACFWBB_32075 [Streptomyces sp. NPDC060000]|uniref:hypothetical protein n=1 Tax=Streptomyces sp. NPDC060000 TaxID=3347031 RepID=UPI00367C4A0B
MLRAEDGEGHSEEYADKHHGEEDPDQRSPAVGGQEQKDRVVLAGEGVVSVCCR